MTIPVEGMLANKKIIMKEIIKIILIFIPLVGVAQQEITSPDVVPFEGSWEASFDQNKTFRLILWGEGNAIKGNYEIDVLNNNGNVQDTYKSNVTIPDTSKEFPPTIYGGTNNNTFASGTLDDNTINAEQGFSARKIKWGRFSLEIQSSNPTTAKWEVERPSGLRLNSEPPNYSIPTDIVLTKQ